MMSARFACLLSPCEEPISRASLRLIFQRQRSCVAGRRPGVLRSTLVARRQKPLEMAPSSPERLESRFRFMAVVGASAAAGAVYGSSPLGPSRCVEQDASPVNWSKQAETGDDGEVYWQYHVPVLVPMQYAQFDFANFDQFTQQQSPFGTPQSTYSAAPSVPQTPMSTYAAAPQSVPQSPHSTLPMPELEPSPSLLPPLAKDEIVPVRVSLRGLPDTVCTNVAYIEAMLEQAGLEDAVLDIARASPGVVRLSLAGTAAAKQCIAHFDGCPWGAGGSLVSAFLADAPESAKHSASRSAGAKGGKRGSGEKGAKGKGKGGKDRRPSSGSEWRAWKGSCRRDSASTSDSASTRAVDSPISGFSERSLALELGASSSGAGISSKRSSLRWADFSEDAEIGDALCSTRDCPDIFNLDSVKHETDPFPFAGTLACE